MYKYDKSKLLRAIELLEQETLQQGRFTENINAEIEKRDQRIAELEAKASAETNRFCITGEVFESGTLEMVSGDGKGQWAICGLKIACKKEDLMALKESPLYRKVGIVILEDQK